MAGHAADMTVQGLQITGDFRVASGMGVKGAVKAFCFAEGDMQVDCRLVVAGRAI